MGQLHKEMKSEVVGVKCGFVVSVGQSTTSMPIFYNHLRHAGSMLLSCLFHVLSHSKTTTLDNINEAKNKSLVKIHNLHTLKLLVYIQSPTVRRWVWSKS